MKTIAVLLAGGTGERFNSGIPKQFIDLWGKPIIIHTLQTFMKNSLIDDVIVVINKNYVNEFKQLLAKHNILLKNVILGGDSRSESTKKAIDYMSNIQLSKDSKILFHDVVRPFVSDDVIEKCILSLNDYNAVGVCIPSYDTLVKTDKNIVEKFISRNEIYRCQTPQGFTFETIKNAYNLAKNDLNFTCDCSIVSKYLPNEKIKVIVGDEHNIKITTKFDFDLANIILSKREQKC